ncbi:MAG: hypothetical protein C5B50_04615 [Verrucomicrobia bacterium]|nr:MAG: hypothetical protein C5B50_04615 [Verrucomicrobiota bacterium]
MVNSVYQMSSPSGIEEAGKSSESNANYAWAEYLDCMEGAPDTVILVKAKPQPTPVLGVVVCFVITLAAYWLNERPFWPFTIQGGRHPLEPVIMSMVVGILIGNLWTLPAALKPGVKFCVKQLMPFGIILLGARLDFKEIVKVGGVGIALSCAEIVLALAIMMLFIRWLKLSGKLGVLLGIGTAICGGTAIVAAAPVIEAEESDVAFGVATVALLGLVAMFALPVLGHFMALPQKAFGMWAGLAIHQTPQVVAAGLAYGDQAGLTATTVKIFRVCLLAPVVFIAGLVYTRQQIRAGGAGSGQVASGKQTKPKAVNYFSLFPKFVFGFLGVALLRTLGWLPDVAVHFPEHAAGLARVQGGFSTASSAQLLATFLIVMSMAGVGLETHFSSMRKTGLRPFFAATASALLIAVASLAAIKLFHIS